VGVCPLENPPPGSHGSISNEVVSPGLHFADHSELTLLIVKPGF